MAKHTSETNGSVNVNELPPEVKALLPQAGNAGGKIEIDPDAVKRWAGEHRYAIGGALGLALLAAWYCCWPKSQPPYPAPAPTHAAVGGAGFQFASYPTPVGAAGVGAPAAAAAPLWRPAQNAKLADNYTVTFTVASVGAVGTSKFLNSHGSYRDPANQSVCLSGAAAAAVHPQMLIGKKVTATGTLKRSEKTGQAYVLVTQPTQLRAE